ncbi:unnamed protein product [Urochloa humidicola]
MASLKLSGSGLPALIILVLVLLQLQPGIALTLEPAGTSTHFPPLLNCAPAPAPAAHSSDNDAAFRANVLSLLDALPSTAAAAPTGFAVTLSGGAGRDRAFARGSCIALGAPPGADWLSCLSAAAQDVAGECAGSRRAGVWRAGCFLFYADTNASTAREDAYHGWFYDDSDGGTPTTALESQQCATDRTTEECSRCLDESARVVPALMAGNQLSMVHGDAVVVVGYACFLRVPLAAPQPRWAKYLFRAIDVFDVLVVVLLELGGVMFCIRTARELDPA